MGESAGMGESAEVGESAGQGESSSKSIALQRIDLKCSEEEFN